jgi:multidrug efflux system membrane fusion protein
MPFQEKTKFTALAALIAAAAIAMLLYLGGRGATGNAMAADAPPAVDVAQVIAKNITHWQSYSGRLEAIDHVDIHALVPGTIVPIYFQDGQMVKKGDPLFLIDPRPYAATVDQGLAQLAAAKARAAFTKRDFDDKSNQALSAEAAV